MQNTSWNDFFKSCMEDDPKLREEYVKGQPDQQIMIAFAGFQQNLTFKEKAKLLGFKKKKLQRIVADDSNSAKLKDLKKLADGMGKTLRIEFVPKEQAVREFMDELTEESGENMDEMMTDLQFKDNLRKELIMYKEYLELLEEGNTDKLKKKFQDNITRIEASLQG